MQSSLKYSYESNVLRVAQIELHSQVKIDVTLTSDEAKTVTVSFNRADSNGYRLGYKQIVRVVRGTIQAIEDVVSTDNSMINALKGPEITIQLVVVSNVALRRLRMYKALIDKHAMRMDQDAQIPFRHVKTDVINNVIKIFIQRTQCTLLQEEAKS